MKIVQLKEAIQIFGNFKLSEIIKMQDRPYECPKCKGEGSLQAKYDAYPKGLPDSGWAQDIKTKIVECEICQGHGYTKKQMRPIVKTEILGYE
ncbi:MULTISPECIES: hypothetical protein [Bacillus cereus group]|uniref:Uncharacterized protein n=1 Tax=Bacillus thuringiensis TaxID=1428 RepID=A0A9X7FXZ6_BACTU|nr:MULTISPECIES: hypothetical protein [Bacillus cereus group]PFT50860.1 hypothetical protein COK72_02305 [Bacillus thuringiensis]PFY22897.1 hypothetical protein COL44_18625 [Bacillus toyonensis]